MTPQERLAAKRANEAVRMAAAFLNNLGVGTLVAGLLSPWASGHPEPWWAVLDLFVAAMLLHFGAQAALRFLLKAEE